MNDGESKEVIELINKSREEIGGRYTELAQKLDNYLKQSLNEEQYKVWTVVNGTKEDEQKLIDEIGEGRYSELLSEITKILSEKTKK